MSKAVWVLAVLALLAGTGCGTDSREDPPEGVHPRSGARCADCHEFGVGDHNVPKVIPEVPPFAVPFLGDRGYRGHPTVSCAGTVREDGQITGCHQIEGGRKSYLVVDLGGLPMDVFCGRCHPVGRHHPSYLHHGDGDDSVRLTIPPPGQPVFGEYAPSQRPEPLRSYPDAIVIDPVAGYPQVLVVLPLASVVDPLVDPPRIADGVVTCVTCHNPHYGYSASAPGAAELQEILGSRRGGDALLRLRDDDNTLCGACHAIGS